MKSGPFRARIAKLPAPPQVPVVLEIDGVQYPADGVRLDMIEGPPAADGEARAVVVRVVIVSETKRMEEAK